MGKKVIDERAVRALKAEGIMSVFVDDDMILTPAAKDAISDLGMHIRRGGGCGGAAAGAGAGAGPAACCGTGPDPSASLSRAAGAGSCGTQAAAGGYETGACSPYVPGGGFGNTAAVPSGCQGGSGDAGTGASGCQGGPGLQDDRVDAELIFRVLSKLEDKEMLNGLMRATGISE